LDDEQAWLNRRFNALTPKHFDENMLLTVQNLDPPPGFSDVWWNITRDQEALVEHIHNGDSSLLVLADPADTRQMDVLSSFLGLLEYSPPLVLVPHSSAPELRSQKRQRSGTDCSQVFTQLVAGIHDVVVGEPEGFKLVCAAQARLRCQNKRMAGMSEVLTNTSEKDYNANLYQQHRAHQLKECIDMMLWEYLRVRLITGLPAIDHSIGLGEPHQIDNFECGTVLGKGSYGKVFMIKNMEKEDPTSTAQVIKSVEKVSASIHVLKELRNEFKAMQLLTEEWPHPNITKLYDVYHSKTHLFFRMECGGLENLSQRLRSRDATGEEFRPMSACKAISVMKQCAGVLSHLHLGPRIAHRDIKPGNIIFSETDDHVMVKLSDFGLAVVTSQKSKCRSARGTLPFMAPEVILDDTHDLFAADVWSMGIVFLELTCFVGFVQKILFKESNRGAERSRDRKKLMGAVSARFNVSGCVQQLLEKHLRQELWPLSAPSTTLLDGMLNLSLTERFGAKDVVDWCPDVISVRMSDQIIPM